MRRDKRRKINPESQHSVGKHFKMGEHRKPRNITKEITNEYFSPEGRHMHFNHKGSTKSKESSEKDKNNSYLDK